MGMETNKNLAMTWLTGGVAGDMSAATNNTLTTTPSQGGNNQGHIGRRLYFLLCADWSGTSPVGTLQAQIGPDGVSWYNYGTPVSVSGNTGGTSIDVINTGAFYVRWLYTRTSGTGTLTGKYSSKGL